MMKTQFLLSSLKNNYYHTIPAYYGIYRKTLDNFITKSHNLHMLCCELNVNFQNPYPPWTNTKPPRRFSGDGSA